MKSFCSRRPAAIHYKRNEISCALNKKEMEIILALDQIRNEEISAHVITLMLMSAEVINNKVLLTMNGTFELYPQQA